MAASLVSRAKKWNGSPAELEEIMHDICEVYIISEIEARAPSLEIVYSSHTVPVFYKAQLHVWLSRSDESQACHHLELASKHLK